MGADRQTTFFVLSCGEFYGEPMAGALGGTSGGVLVLWAGQGLGRRGGKQAVWCCLHPPHQRTQSCLTALCGMGFGG